jgi:CRISPR-associated endoribonuclease Cas6
MPAVIEVHLARQAGLAVYPARLHGAACTLLESPDADHTAQRKPFSVGPLIDRGDGVGWTLGWLAHGPPPQVTSSVRFGRTCCPVLAHRVDHCSFAELAATLPVRHAELEIVSPMFFSRNGRDHPLPDPVLIVRSALNRWNHHAPAALAVNDELSRMLLATVWLADMHGRTVRASVTATMDQAGFVGTVRLALLAHADRTTAAVFGALMRFAAIAGLGAQTTHGFGVTRLLRLEPGES